MTILNAARVAIACLLFARIANAQPPTAATNDSSAALTRSVTVSLAEYNRLLDLANRPSPRPPAPVGAVLTSADLRVRVGSDAVRGVFSLTGDVLQEGISRVPLIGGATIIDGTATGGSLPLTADDNMHTALLPGPGPFALTLEWGAPLAFVPGRASFTLPVPPAGTARATIDLPGDQPDIRITPGLITSRTAANGRTSVEVTLRPGSPTQVSWSMRDSAPASAARDVRTLADVMTLVTIADSDVRMAALVDVTVVQGEPRSIDVRLPAGYELADVSGSSIASSRERQGTLTLTIDPGVRRHQFLVSLERAHDNGSFTLDTGFVSLLGAQRERGEVAIEGVGTIDLTTNPTGAGMQRIDVRELNAAVQSLARLPLLSAFRFQRNAAAAPGLRMDVKRFADAGVLAAVADHAVATTVVTGEGRALTEIALTVQNRAQPYLKVSLPTGATMVSVEVAGAAAKPVEGADGTRVPLLRPGFRPTGTYTVSFVYLHAGTPFLKKGDFQMALPRMDMPVAVVDWEVFVPERYAVRAVGGNVIDRVTFDAAAQRDGRHHQGDFVGGVAGGLVHGRATVVAIGGALGQIRGRVIDGTGAPLPGTSITLTVGPSRRTAVTDGNGGYVFTGVARGTATVSAQLPGFDSESASVAFDRASHQVDFTLSVSALKERVTVTGASPAVRGGREQLQAAEPPSQNVINLQQRVAGILPVRVDVPRAGVSHMFIKPLVVDQETVVNLKYKRR